MNCKPGDLAVIVRSTQGNEGRIVRCISFLPTFNWRAPMGRAPTWIIDPPLQNTDPRGRNVIPDAFLRPIRDPGDDARDETLDWLPVPIKEVA